MPLVSPLCTFSLFPPCPSLPPPLPFALPSLRSLLPIPAALLPPSAHPHHQPPSHPSLPPPFPSLSFSHTHTRTLPPPPPHPHPPILPLPAPFPPPRTPLTSHLRATGFPPLWCLPCIARPSAHPLPAPFPCPQLAQPLPVAAPPLAPSTPLPPVHPSPIQTAPTLPRLPVSALHPRDRVRLPTAQRWCARGHYRPSPLIPHHAPKQAFLPPASRLPALSTAALCPCVTLAHFIPPPPSPPPPGFSLSSPACSPTPLSTTSLHPPSCFPHSHSAPHTSTSRTSPSSLPFPPSYFRIQPTYPSLPLPLPNSTPPFLPPAKVYTPCFCSLGCAVPNLPPPFRGTRPPLPPPANFCTPCSCPLCPPTPYLNPPQSPPSPTPSIFPPPWGSPIRSYHPSSIPQFPLSPVSRPRILSCIYHSTSFRCPLCPPTFSPPASQPSHYPLPGSRQLDYPLPFAPSSLFPTLPFPPGSTCPPPPPVEFCPALPTSGPPPVPTPCSPTATPPPPPHLHYSPPTLPLSIGPQPAPPLGPQSPPTHIEAGEGRARGELAADTAREGVSEFVCEGAAEATEDGAAKAAREGAMGVVGEGAAEAAEERAAEAAREGAAAAARERAAGAAREGAAGTVTLARQRAEAMETGFAGVGATEPAAVSAGGTAAEEAIGTAPVEAARTAAGATEATAGAGIGGGATGAAGKGVTGTGARESAAPAVAREGTAGASKAEGEAAAEAAGRAIARPVGAAGAAANSGKHTAGPAGPAETAKGASSKAAAGGVGLGDIGATGEGEGRVVPTGVGTEEGDVIAIEEDEGEDVMHIDGPLAQYLTLDGEADPAPLQPHVEVPPLPPMPVPMLAEGPMEGLGETLRTEPREGAPILTSRPPAHQPPGAPLPHPHPQVPVVSRGAAKALAFLAEPCSPTPTLLHGQPPSPSPTPDPTVAGGPPGEHAGQHTSAPTLRGSLEHHVEQPGLCPSTPTSNPLSRPGSPRVAPLGSHHPPHTACPICSHGGGCFEESGDAHRAPPAWRTTHPPSTHPFGPTAPPSFTNRRGQPGWPPAEEQGQRRQRVSPRTPPPSLPHQEPLPTSHPVEQLPGPTSTARPPNLHSRPAPAPPQGHGSGPAHSPPFCPSRAVSPSQVAAAAIATGRGAVGLRDAPMADATDSPSHPSHPFHVDDPLPQPMVIGEGQGGLLGQGPHPSSAQPARPTPPSTLPALLLSPTGRQVFETPEEVRAGISDLLAIHRLSSSPAAPTLPVPQDRTRTYAEVTRSVPSFIPPATQPGASLPTPMETDRGLRPCHSHLDGVAPPPVQPVAQEVTSSRDEASAPTETPPPGVAEPSLEPHPAEGQEHTTAHTSGSPPRPPSPASTPVPARGPALSCATPPLSSLTPPPRGAGESSPPLIPGDPVGAQAAHGVPSTASSDATAPIDPADTATSPDQVVSCPTCRSSLANRRALQHHIPFCHPADAARRAQAAHDTASIIPSLSQPRATGMQFTDAQWQTLDSVDWTEYFSPERIHTRPLRRVPERVRGGYLDVLSAILVRIAQDPEAAGPTFLLAAAPTLFLVPATPPDRSHTAAIATRISRFGRGEWAELVSDALGRRTPLPRRTGHRSRTATDPSAADERRIARCLRLAACNETSRACAALESAEAAPDTQGTIQRLQSKHPNAERPTPAWLSGFQGSPLVLSVDHLRRAIFTAPRGSSGGPSGWVAEHLRDTFLAFPQSLHFLLAVYQQWLRGRCAPAARSLLASSTLVALAKSNMDVRPIAIGEVLVRILSRAVCLQLRDQMARVFLASQQFGVGVTCGTEVVVRGVRRALADHPDWVVLQLDVANAFNSFHRDRMFQALQASPEFQCLIPFIGLFYGTPSDLHYRSGTGVVTMHSERGTRQGDPLSPFLYALTQRLALEPVLAEGDVQLWSYADDTYVLGPPDRVLHHFAEIVRRLGEMGLAAQPHKCLVYQTESFLSRDLEAFTGLGIEVARRGLTVTGVPVGTVSFVEQSLPDRLERMGRVLPWLPRLRQPQTAARLLSACVSTRPQYLSRTVPPSPAVISSFTRWDARLGETFQQLLASGTWACREDVREAALDQIFLPIRLGGFGIRRMARMAPVSFVCSWVQCAPILCSLPACGEVFRQSFASGEPEQIDRALQTALEGLPPDVLSLLPPWPSCASASPDSLFAGASRLLEAHALEAVRARHTSPLHLARLTSLQGGGAGAWLTSVPYADPLRIPEALWQAASSSRLGLPIPQLALAGQCSCGQAIDDMTVPHHAVRCPRYGVATTIHDTVKYMLRDFAVEAGFAVKVEDSTLFTQLEAARARLLGQPVVGEGTRAEGPGERRGEAGQPGGGGQWGRHQLRGQVERGTGGQRGRQGEQTGQDGEGGRHRQQQESQWRPRAQGAAPPGSASGAGQGREQQRADGGTGGAAGLGGEGQGVREAAGDGAGGSGGLGEGREGEGRGQVDGGEERGRETIGEGAPRDQTGQQPAQQQGPVGLHRPSDPQREGNVQLRRATPTQIGVAAARRVQEKLRHWGPHLEGLQPAPHFYACVAETFGLLSEPLRQFLGLCAKRIAQRRRDRGGGDDGSARIFEAGLTTRLSVALQRAQAQCMIQHAVRQLGSHTPCPLMPSAPPAPTLRVPAPLPPLLTLPAPLAVSHRPPFAPPRPCAPLVYLLLPPPLLCCTPLPSPRRPTPLPAPPQSAPCPSYLAPLCLVSPLPAPRRLSPPPTSPLSLPPHSPTLALGFLPPCPTFPPSVCSASPLPAPPSSPPCPSFSAPPRPVSPLPAPPFLSPCLSSAPSLPPPAHAPVFGFSPPCPTFLPSLPTPSAPPLFSPHPLLLPSLPLISRTPALVSYHPCPSFPPLCTFSLFPPCPSLPPPLPFALPSLRSLLPIPAALLPPSAHPHHQPPSHPSLPPSLSLSLFLTHTHAHSPPPPPTHILPFCPSLPLSHPLARPSPPTSVQLVSPPYGASLASLAPLLTLCPPLFRALSWPSPCPLLPLPLPPQLPCPPYTPVPSNRPHPPPAARFRSPPPRPCAASNRPTVVRTGRFFARASLPGGPPPRWVVGHKWVQHEDFPGGHPAQYCSTLFTQLEAARARLLGQPVVGEGTRAEGPGERRGVAGQPGGGGQWGRHQLRGQVERGTGGQRGRQGEQTGQDREGGRHRQQQESQWRPRAQGAAPPGSALGAGQGREQQRADGGTGGAAGLGGEGQGVREAAGDGAGGSGGLGEGREGEGRGQVDGGEERGRETIGEGAPRDQTGQQPAQQQGPVGRTGRVGTASRIPDPTCRDVGQGLMVLVDVSIADPQREGNVQLRRATPTQIGVAAARRSHPLPPHAIRSPRPYPPRARSLAASFDPPCPPRRFPPPAIRSSPPVRSPRLPSPPPSPPLLHASSFPSPTHSTPCPSSIRTLPLVSRPPMLGFSPPCPSPPFSAPTSPLSLPPHSPTLALGFLPPCPTFPPSVCSASPLPAPPSSPPCPSFSAPPRPVSPLPAPPFLSPCLSSAPSLPPPAHAPVFGFSPPCPTFLPSLPTPSAPPLFSPHPLLLPSLPLISRTPALVSYHPCPSFPPLCTFSLFPPCPSLPPPLPFALPSLRSLLPIPAALLPPSAHPHHQPPSHPSLPPSLSLSLFLTHTHAHSPPPPPHPHPPILPLPAPFPPPRTPLTSHLRATGFPPLWCLPCIARPSAHPLPAPFPCPQLAQPLPVAAPPLAPSTPLPPVHPSPIQPPPPSPGCPFPLSTPATSHPLPPHAIRSPRPYPPRARSLAASFDPPCPPRRFPPPAIRSSPPVRSPRLPSPPPSPPLLHASSFPSPTHSTPCPSSIRTLPLVSRPPMLGFSPPCPSPPFSAPHLPPLPAPPLSHPCPWLPTSLPHLSPLCVLSFSPPCPSLLPALPLVFRPPTPGFSPPRASLSFSVPLLCSLPAPACPCPCLWLLPSLPHVSSLPAHPLCPSLVFPSPIASPSLPLISRTPALVSYHPCPSFPPLCTFSLFPPCPSLPPPLPFALPSLRSLLPIPAALLPPSAHPHHQPPSHPSLPPSLSLSLFLTHTHAHSPPPPPTHILPFCPSLPLSHPLARPSPPTSVQLVSPPYGASLASLAPLLTLCPPLFRALSWPSPCPLLPLPLPPQLPCPPYTPVPSNRPHPPPAARFRSPPPRPCAASNRPTVVRTGRFFARASLPGGPPPRWVVVAAAAIATGRGAVGLRDAPMADATDSPSHPSHPFHVDDPLPQPMVIGEGQGGLLGQGPHPSSAQPARPTPPSTLPALLLSPTGRQVFETPEEVRAGISDLLAIHRLSSSPAAPTLPVPQDRTRTYAEVTRSVPSFIPPATQPGASLPTPMETDRGLRPCHSHLDGVAPPPVQPVAQEVTSSRDEASAPTETPPPGVAEPSLEPHPAEGQEHTTAHTSGSPPRPPLPSFNTGAGTRPGPILPPTGSPLQPVPTPRPRLTPADTATSPDQVVSCPTCRSSLANRRALQHHIPFCHPADAARRAQAAHDTASIIPSLSQPRATGMQFTDAQWQTLDSVDWTEYFSPERIHTRPLRRVPERVRGGYLDVLSAILVRIAQDPEAAGPTFLLAAAPTLFLVPATPPDRSHTAAIATRISRFGRGEWAELVSDALGRRTPLPRRTGHRSRTATDPSAADERRIARCLRLAACNETSRACAALESAEAAPDTQGTIQRLQSKHPNAERPTPAWLSGFQGSPLVLSVDHLRRAIFTAPRGSSGGPSGWVAEHLRDTFLAFPQSLHFLLAVYQQWLRGRCAPAARSLLASSTLVALAKSNMDVRPIAIGEVLVRILSRAVCLQLRDQMARVFLASQQFGVGVTCGTEVVVRGVRRALADHPDWVVLQLDVANAFNSFHRDRMFQALQASPEFQCLIPFIGLFYGTPSDLHYRSGTGVVTMHSERGTRQGDPLSPFLYALTQRLALEPVLAEGDVQLWSYADDTYVLGPPDRVLHHFAEIVRRLGEMGLAAQPHKCLVYQTESFLSRDLEAFTGLGIEVARRGLTVTGVPVGTVSFVEQSLPDRLERMGRVLPWLPRLRQPQTAARLLSACVSTRPQYLSRTVPPSPAVISSFTRWDARLGETFQQLLASGTWACREDVREAALDQIFLPIRLGGFGIRRMARMAPVSFVCSWVQCAPILCSLPACGEVFRQSFASGEPEQIDRALQTALEGLPPDVLSLLPPWPSCASASPDSLFAGASRLLEAHALEAVRARHTSPLHLARLTSLQGGGAGAWLTSVPYADPLRIPEALWQAASSSRLGLPIPQLALAGQCSCGQAIDDMTVPHHAVRCPRYGVATTIHDTVKYMLRDFAVEAGFAVKVEDSTLFTQLEAARARLLGQPVVGEGTRAEGPGERRGEAGQPGGGGQWGRHQLRGQVERGTGGQRGRQGEQTGQDGEGGRHRQQQESQWRPRAQGAAPPGSASGAGQGREQQRADGGTGGAAGLGGEGQGVREAAGDGAGGGLMVLVDVSIADPQREGNVQLRRATPTQIGVAAARRVQEKLRHWGPHLEGLQPAPHFTPQRRRDRGGGDDGSARIFEAGLTTRLSVALQRAQAQCMIQHASHPLPPHAIRSPRPYPPRARSLAASFDPPCPPRRFPPPAIRSSPPVRSPRLPSPPPYPSSAAQPLPSPRRPTPLPAPPQSAPCPSYLAPLCLVSPLPAASPPFSAPTPPPSPCPPTLPTLALGFLPPCLTFPPSVCSASPSLPLPPPRPALVSAPPTPGFSPSPRLPFFPPCLSSAPSLPPPAHAPVLASSLPATTFLPSLPTPSALPSSSLPAPPFLPPCPLLSPRYLSFSPSLLPSYHHQPIPTTSPPPTLLSPPPFPSLSFSTHTHAHSPPPPPTHILPFCPYPAPFPPPRTPLTSHLRATVSPPMVPPLHRSPLCPPSARPFPCPQLAQPLPVAAPPLAPSTPLPPLHPSPIQPPPPSPAARFRSPPRDRVRLPTAQR
ncbi:unnamed protein product, partial [Closterium sp. NIES-65]